MDELKELWERTKSCHNKLEKELVGNYINFLREVAKYYLKKDRRVFFKENRVVHWGEGDFGRLLIEGKEDITDVFGDYIVEIKFALEIPPTAKQRYIEISMENLDAIKYRVDER